MFKKESIAIATQSHKPQREPRSQTPKERPDGAGSTSKVPTEKPQPDK